MSDPRDLDEIPEKEIRLEIDRRACLRDAGFCDYCGRPVGCEPTCKERSRHRGVAESVSSSTSVERVYAFVRPSAGRERVDDRVADDMDVSALFDWATLEWGDQEHRHRMRFVRAMACRVLNRLAQSESKPPAESKPQAEEEREEVIENAELCDCDCHWPEVSRG